MDIINDALKKQLESVAETLQMIYLDKECPEDIAKILFNQIGILTLCSEEIKSMTNNFNN